MTFLQKPCIITFKYDHLHFDSQHYCEKDTETTTRGFDCPENLHDFEKYLNDLELYCQGHVSLKSEQYLEAYTIFKSLDFLNCSSLVNTCIDNGLEQLYQNATTLIANKDYKAAKITLVDLGEYKDAKELIKSINTYIIDADYNEAVSLYQRKQYESAKIIFDRLSKSYDDYLIPIGGYKESIRMAEKCKKKIDAKSYQELRPLIIPYSILIPIFFVVSIVEIIIPDGILSSLFSFGIYPFAIIANIFVAIIFIKDINNSHKSICWILWAIFMIICIWGIIAGRVL